MHILTDMFYCCCLQLRERNEDRKLRLREVTPKLPKILKWTLDRTEARERQKQFNLLKLKSETRIREIESKKTMEDLARKEGRDDTIDEFS